MTAKREIERKYLLAEAPSIEDPLLREAETLFIKQTYLVSDEDGVSERVRRVRAERSGKTGHYHTIKRDVGGLVRSEVEREISEEDYRALLRRRCPDRATIRKRRLCFEFERRQWELDLYERPAGVSILEIELADEGEHPALPHFALGAQDVSLDRSYRANSLARELRQHEIRFAGRTGA